jgi:hypothetical protein
MRAPEIIVLGIAVGLIASRYIRPPRPAARQVDAELARLVDRATVELVQERVARSPLPVRLGVGHGLRGAHLCLQADDLWLRLRLYRELPSPVTGAGATARLAGLRFAESRGWEVRLDGSPYPEPVLLGWRIEIRARPRPTPEGAGAAAWWDR